MSTARTTDRLLQAADKETTQKAEYNCFKWTRDCNKSLKCFDETADIWTKAPLCGCGIGCLCTACVCSAHVLATFGGGVIDFCRLVKHGIDQCAPQQQTMDPPSTSTLKNSA